MHRAAVVIPEVKHFVLLVADKAVSICTQWLGFDNITQDAVGAVLSDTQLKNTKPDH